MIEIETQASLAAFGYAPCGVTAVIIEQAPAQRFGRALAGLGMFWAFALGGLFNPVAHFVSWNPDARDRRDRGVTILAWRTRSASSCGMHGVRAARVGVGREN